MVGVNKSPDDWIEEMLARSQREGDKLWNVPKGSRVLHTLRETPGSFKPQEEGV